MTGTEEGHVPRADEPERLSVEEALLLMTVPTMSGVYVLNAGIERRISNHSQQVRALNLIAGLVQQGILGSGKSVGIVGAGVSGVTAAAAALYLGMNVEIIERNGSILENESFVHSPRYVHPHLYDWPHPRFTQEWSNLPLLTWRAEEMQKMISDLLRQWGYWERLYAEKLTVTLLATCVKVEARNAGVAVGSPQLTWNTPKGDSCKSFDVVILAVGFGKEQQLVRERDRGGHTDYWESRNFSTRGRTVIVGRSDGALAEVIARSFRFGEHWLEERYLADWASKKKEKITAQVLSDAERYLSREIEKDVSEGLLTLSGLNLDLAVRHDPDDPKLFEATFDLNRVFVNYLIEHNLIGKVRVDSAEYITYDNMRQCFNAPVAGKEPKTIQWESVIERTGSELPLKTDFGHVWKALDDGRLLEHGSGLRRGSGFAIAEAPAIAAAQPLLYSDLFDSVTQREIFLSLCHRHNQEYCPESWEASDPAIRSAFVDLLWNVLRVRISKGTRFVFTDNQVLDGLWFQGIMSDTSRVNDLGQLSALVESGKVEFRCRQRPAEQVNAYVRKAFEFSSMVTQGKQLNSWMSASGRRFDTYSDLYAAVVSAPELDRAVSTELEETMKRIRCIQAWLECSDFAGPPRFRVCSHPFFPLGTSFEDPGGFIDQLLTSEGACLGIDVFRSGSNRSDAFKPIDAFEMKYHREDDQLLDARAVRSWYSRAYNRALAMQHEVAIFETTHVFNSLWWARALKLDRADAPPYIGDRGARIRSCLELGTRSFGRQDVPDARAPGIHVPYAMDVLLRTDANDSTESHSFDWDQSLSIIEYLKSPKDDAGFACAFDASLGDPTSKS